MEKRNFRFYAKKLLDYLIRTMNGMAYGLFSTLIIGTIIATIADLVNAQALAELALILKRLTGVGIGIGIAWSLKLDSLRLIAAGIAGGIASGLQIGDPVVEYICIIAAVEVLRLLRWKTPVDIIIIPLLSALVAYGCFLLINQPVSQMMQAIGAFISWAT
ncbi:MAG: hypothetical protein GX661_06540, partial [Acholeplasmataceae bacterium]|nr:hypothetical protein [Acholeplasmataceae bacterium]